MMSSYDDSAPVDYETRLVAFLDILGWRQAVEHSINDSALRMKLLNAAWFFAQRTKQYVEEDTPDHPSNDEYSQFSDSLIVSFPYNHARDLHRLMKFVIEFQMSTLINGLPIRGGITVGPVFHSGAIAFGPAINEAYGLESTIAKYPRVIISHKLDGDVKRVDRMQGKDWPFVVKDDDGYFSTEYLTGYARTKKMAQHLDEKFDHWLELHRDNANLFAKYTWLRGRWHAAKAHAERPVCNGDKE
jgi:hypothetical protein